MDYKVILAEKDATIAELKGDITQLRHELDQLKKMIFGSKRERYIEEVNANQLSLFTTDEVETDKDQADRGQHIEYDRKATKKHKVAMNCRNTCRFRK